MGLLPGTQLDQPGEQQMPLLMEGLGGSIWPLALAHILEEQALGMLLTQPGTPWDRKLGLCSIWESVS